MAPVNVTSTNTSGEWILNYGFPHSVAIEWIFWVFRWIHWKKLLSRSKLQAQANITCVLVKPMPSTKSVINYKSLKLHIIGFRLINAYLRFLILMNYFGIRDVDIVYLYNQLPWRMSLLDDYRIIKCNTQQFSKITIKPFERSQPEPY